MLNYQLHTRFKKEYKKQQKRNKQMEKLDLVMKKIIMEEPLEEKYQDHLLIGNYAGYRECHIEPDSLLIYFIDKKMRTVTFARTGAHSDLFNK